MWVTMLLILFGGVLGLAFFGWAGYVASRRLSVEQRGGDLVVVNSGAEVRAAQISLVVGGQQVRLTRDRLPSGETILKPEEFAPPCPPLGPAAFEGGSVTGSRSVGGIGFGWTWYTSGPLTVAAEVADRDPP